MKECKPVEISNGAFNFCKYSISIMLWLSVLIQSKALLVVCFCILTLSTFLKVKKSPLVFFYEHSIDKLFASRKELLDENAVWFAHFVGAVFSGVALMLVYYVNVSVGWSLVIVLALAKTFGAFGFCGAMKLYGCLNNPNGSCCRFGKKLKNL